MKITLSEIPVRDVFEGYQNHNEEGGVIVFLTNQ